MKDWLSRTQIRQRPMLAVYGGLLVLIAVVIGLGALRWLSSSSSDRLAVIGNLLSLGTLLLALVAGIVALAAYSAATGLPNLRMQLALPSSYNEATFVVPGKGDPVSLDTIARITVENTSAYAARTPAVIIEFHAAGIERSMYSPEREWSPVSLYRKGDITAFQWDGGPVYSIHGNSSRHLPDLDLRGLRPYSASNEAPEMVIRLLADGYQRSKIVLPMVFDIDVMPRGDGGFPPEWL